LYSIPVLQFVPYVPPLFKSGGIVPTSNGGATHAKLTLAPTLTFLL